MTTGTPPSTGTDDRTTGDRQAVLRAAGVMAAGGVIFMIPVVGFPGVHANFDDDPAARLAGLEAHWTNYLIGSALFSLGWLLMGIGIFLVCRGLGELESGRSAAVLRVAGPVLLVPFLVLAVVYAVPEAWGVTPAEWAAVDESSDPAWFPAMFAAVIATILIGWLTVSTILARSEHWPTWLGVVFGLLGLATVVTQLPLFAALGAIVLGVTVRRQTRRRQAAVPSVG